MGCVSFNSNYDYSFSDDLIAKTRDLNKLLTLELELSRKCNYNCKYCYTKAGNALEQELTLDELCDVVEQARELGVRTIILIGGGEPFLYNHLRTVMEYIYNRNISMIIFTNGSMIDKETADFLYRLNVLPVLKVNGLQAKVVNWLCSNKSAYKNITNAIKCFEQAGYLEAGRKIGITTVICKQNYDQILPLWEWARDNNVIPYFERVIPQGRANGFNLSVEREELQSIFNQLKDLDKRKYNMEWENDYMPIAGVKCNRHFYSIYINADGQVQPCSGVDINVGNIRNQSLKDIITHSEVIQNLRHIDSTIKGKCKTCHRAFKCYGCRGNAYQMEKDYLAADPMCWVESSIGPDL